MHRPTPLSFPDVDNPKWKTLLYLMIIHGRIKNQHIERLFNGDEWVLETLKELEKSGIVIKRSASTFVLDRAARPHIEQWLREIKILN